MWRGTAMSGLCMPHKRPSGCDRQLAWTPRCPSPWACTIGGCHPKQAFREARGAYCDKSDDARTLKVGRRRPPPTCARAGASAPALGDPV